MNKAQRQAHREWAPIPPGVVAGRDPLLYGGRWGYNVDRDPGDEHDPDGVIEHREYIAAINVGRVRRGEQPIEVRP